VIQLEDGTRTLLLVGDLLHTPPQVAHPTWVSNHDEDPELAAEHRALWIDAASREGWAVAVGHFGQPFGSVAAAGWSPA
jgi:glyoxylase-like metal-dependent hydrolase (beta-lactamase superfamily II)